MNNSHIGKQYDLSLLKVLAILLVVLGHSNYKTIQTYLGGVDYSSYINGSLANRLIDFIISSIYFFHMPLFVFISGAVYYYGNFTVNKKKDFETLLKKKFNRLLIPYFTIGILYMVPVKLISNFYQIESIPKILGFGMGLSLDSGHLWYLVMLFNIYIVFYFLENVLSKTHIVINLIFLVIIYIFAYKLPTNILQIADVNRYLIYFYLGYVFQAKKEKILNFMNGKIILFFVAALLYFIILNFFFREANFGATSIDIFIYKELLLLVIALVGILMCYLFVAMLSKKLANNKIIRILDEYNFSIYLLHDPINYIILALCYSYGLFNIIATNSINTIIYVGLRFLTTLLLPIALAFLYKRVKKL